MKGVDQRLQSWIEQTGIVFHDEVHAQLALCVSFVYYHQDVTTSREAVVECMEHYLSLTGDYMTYWAMLGQHMKVYDDETAAILQKTYKNEDINKALDFYIHSGPSKEEACAFSISSLDKSAWQTNLGKTRGTSNIRFFFPLGFFSERGDTLNEFVTFCAKRIKPYWGYAGIALSKPFELMKMNRLEPFEYMLAWAMPELDVQQLSIGVYAHQGLRPPSWITVLGSEEVEQLGGIETLAKSLPAQAGFILTPYEGGLIIQAGSEPFADRKLFGSWEEFIADDTLNRSSLNFDPELFMKGIQNEELEQKYSQVQKLLQGDLLPIPKAPRDKYPLLYKLAKVLKPLRAYPPSKLHDGFYGVPFFDEARTLEYFERYDESISE